VIVLRRRLLLFWFPFLVVILCAGIFLKGRGDGSTLFLHESGRGTVIEMHNEREGVARRLLYCLPTFVRKLLPLRYQVNFSRAFKTPSESIFVIIGQRQERGLEGLPSDMSLTLLDANGKELGEFSALYAWTDVYSSGVQFPISSGGVTPLTYIYERERKTSSFRLQPWAIPAPSGDGPFFVRVTYTVLPVNGSLKQSSTFRFKIPL
jgi:hypothetical protein